MTLNNSNSFKHIKYFNEEFKNIFKKDLQIELLSQNPQLRYYLEQITILRAQLDQLGIKIEQMKDQKQKDFQKAHDFKKSLNSYEHRIQRDIISSCLFGNSIAI